jgi:hypothetical protein
VVSSTVRLARTEVMRARFAQARTLLEPALDRAAAGADAPGKARLEAELCVWCWPRILLRAEPGAVGGGMPLAQRRRRRRATCDSRTWRRARSTRRGIFATERRSGRRRRTSRPPGSGSPVPGDLFCGRPAIASGVAQETFLLPRPHRGAGREAGAPARAALSRGAPWPVRRWNSGANRATRTQYALRHLRGRVPSESSVRRDPPTENALALHRRWPSALEARRSRPVSAAVVRLRPDRPSATWSGRRERSADARGQLHRACPLRRDAQCTGAVLVALSALVPSTRRRKARPAWRNTSWRSAPRSSSAS